MFSSEILGSQRGGHSGEIEAGAFVPNHQRDARFVVTLATNMDFFSRILAIAVKDGICQVFTKRELNREFAARITMIFANLEHQFIDERRDRVDFTFHRKLHVQVGPPRIEGWAASYWCCLTDSSRPCSGAEFATERRGNCSKASEGRAFTGTGDFG